MAEGGAVVVLAIIAGLALVLAAAFAILWHRRRPGALQAEAARFKSAAIDRGAEPPGGGRPRRVPI